jgi:hypothetical protein
MNDNVRRPLRFSLRSLLLTAAGISIAFGALIPFWPTDHRTVRRLWGGPDGLALLRHAERVEAYRLGALSNINDWQTARVSDYPTTAGPVAVPNAVVARLARALGDPKSFLWDDAKACIIRPGVRLDFIRGNDRLQILLCFECDNLSNYLNGESVGSRDPPIVC